MAGSNCSPPARLQRYTIRFPPDIINENSLGNQWAAEQHRFHPYPETLPHHTNQFTYQQKPFPSITTSSRLDDQWKAYSYNTGIFVENPLSSQAYERVCFQQKHDERYFSSAKRPSSQELGLNEKSYINDIRLQTQDAENVRDCITRKESNIDLKRRIDDSNLNDKHRKHFLNKMAKMEDMKLLGNNAEICKASNDKHFLSEEFKYSVDESNRQINDTQEAERQENLNIPQLTTRQVYLNNTALEAYSMHYTSPQLKTRSIYSSSLQPVARTNPPSNPRTVIMKTRPSNSELKTRPIYSNSPQLVARPIYSSSLAKPIYVYNPQLEIKNNSNRAELEIRPIHSISPQIAARPINSNSPQLIARSIHLNSPMEESGFKYSNYPISEAIHIYPNTQQLAPRSIYSYNSKAEFIDSNYPKSNVRPFFSNSQQIEASEIYLNSPKLEVRPVSVNSQQLEAKEVYSNISHLEVINSSNLHSGTKSSYLSSPHFSEREISSNTPLLTMRPIFSSKDHIHSNCDEFDEKLKKFPDAQKGNIYLQSYANNVMNDSRRDRMNPLLRETNITENFAMAEHEITPKNYVEKIERISHHTGHSSNSASNSLALASKVNLCIPKEPDSFKINSGFKARPHNLKIFTTRNNSFEEKGTNFITGCLNTMNNEGKEFNNTANQNIPQISECSITSYIKKPENIKQDSINSSTLEARLRCNSATITGVGSENNKNTSNKSSSNSYGPCIHLKQPLTTHSQEKLLHDFENINKPFKKLDSLPSQEKYLLQNENHSNYNNIQSPSSCLRINNNTSFVKVVKQGQQPKILPLSLTKDRTSFPQTYTQKSAESVGKNGVFPFKLFVKKGKTIFPTSTKQLNKIIRSSNRIFSKLNNDNKTNFASSSNRNGQCSLSSDQQSNDIVGNSKLISSEIGTQNDGPRGNFNRKFQDERTVDKIYLENKDSNPSNTKKTDDPKEIQKLTDKSTNCSNLMLSPIQSYTTLTMKWKQQISPILSEKCVTKGISNAPEKEKKLLIKRMDSSNKNYDKLLKNEKSPSSVAENLSRAIAVKEKTSTGHMLQIRRDEKLENKKKTKGTGPIIEHLKKVSNPPAKKDSKNLLKRILALQTSVMELKVAKRNLSLSTAPKKEIPEEDLISEFENEVFLAVFKQV
ncbi:uncharacterized protein NPIL_169741 [Nephila pilipes]|uniref:Uncharacterized protein n=1 Tax=Nephila pilipes TaxID=299642 RepID=A0A8X6IM37_NEPPI|nr:uncharacterized protein NPIL_169741 [Nephila pilipes]